MNCPKRGRDMYGEVVEEDDDSKVVEYTCTNCGWTEDVTEYK